MKIPSTRSSFILRHEYLAEFIALGAAALVAFIGAVRVEGEHRRAVDLATRSDQLPPANTTVWVAWSVLLLVAVAGAMKVWASATKVRMKTHEESPDDLLGCCHVLWEMLAPTCAGEAPDGLRVTIYRVVSRRKGKVEELEQVIPYAVGDGGKPGKAGRRFSARSGIIGRVARTGTMFAAGRVSEDTVLFRKEMVEAWGFGPDEAREIDDSRWSWMGVPIRDDNGKVIGVIYLDSQVKLCFDGPEVKRQVMRACDGIMRYARRRYP